MRKEHLESVRRWANFVKANPKKWKKIHTGFINALFNKHYTFLKKLLKDPNGKEKIIKLYKITNFAGYKTLLK